MGIRAPLFRAAGLLGAVAVMAATSACGGTPSTEAPAAERAAQTASPRGAVGSLTIGGARLRLVYRGDAPAEARRRIESWVQRGAEMVTAYCGGHFPVPDLRIEIIVRSGGGVGFGQHFVGRRLRLRVGRDVTEDELQSDWVMVHEMLHTALPDLSRRHRWMQEGLSTYLESVTRARAGYLAEEEVYRIWTRRMPHGQPISGDRGLDRTSTWGRVYWGGALFWLSVDVELQRRTGGRVSLDDAIRGVLAAGGNSRANWSPERVVSVGDQATETNVLADLYAAQALTASEVDLDALWVDLGVERGPSGAISFREDAPDAAIRRQITAPR
ncbi:MAG: hypothetical protein JRH11_20685 [Deltaproteobacteria bacterium]|nr:hypothetical protein [Deltaproteobacteria bacterium]